MFSPMAIVFYIVLLLAIFVICVFRFWGRSDVELVRKDGIIHNQIRGDAFPRGTLVIEQDGRFFVRTRQRDVSFLIYREDARTEHYTPTGE